MSILLIKILAELGLCWANCEKEKARSPDQKRKRKGKDVVTSLKERETWRAAATRKKVLCVADAKKG